MAQFTVFSKDNCPQCVQAKAMITAAGHTYTEKLFGKDLSRTELLSEFPGLRMMPGIKDEAGNVIAFTELKNAL